MGMFDDAVGGAVPGGNLTKPLVIAAGALILAKWLGGGKDDSPIMPAPHPAPAPHPQTIPVNTPDDGLSGGLGGLLEKLRNGGQAPAANSWVSTGPNQPITPADLGSALGKTTITEIAQKAGVSEQDILDMLSQALPGIVDSLTPQGRVPTQAEVNNYRR